MTEAHLDTDPEPHPEVLAGSGGEDTPDERMRRLDQVLTKRINDLRTDFTRLENDLSKKIDTNSADLRTLKTSVSNNSESIRSFTDAINQVKKVAADGAKRVASLEQQVKQDHEAQQQIDAELSKNTADVRQHADDIAANAHAELLSTATTLNEQLTAAVSQLSESIEAVRNAPVKPHTHHIALSGDAGGPVEKGGQ